MAITQSPQTELLQRFFSEILPSLGDPRTANTVRGVGNLEGGGGVGGGIEDIIGAILGRLSDRDDDDDDRDDPDPTTSDQNPEDLSTADLVGELGQSVKGFEGFGEQLAKMAANALTVPGLSGFMQGLRDAQTLQELQDRGVLDPGLSVADLQGLDLASAIEVSEAFESFGGAPTGGDFGTSLGGSAGDFEGVDFGGTSLGGSAGDFEGTDFGGFDDTPSDPGQDPEGGFGDGDNGDEGGNGNGSSGGDDEDDEDDNGDEGSSGGDDGDDEHKGSGFIHGPDPKRRGEDVRKTLQEGEAVLNRELVQLLGPDLINTLNEMAQGRVNHANRRV